MCFYFSINKQCFVQKTETNQQAAERGNDTYPPANSEKFLFFPKQIGQFFCIHTDALDWKT